MRDFRQQKLGSGLEERTVNIWIYKLRKVDTKSGTQARG
jgi:hypothetical protein